MNIARKRRILKWLAALAGLGLLALAAASYAAMWALNYQAPCSQPCRDLGIYPPEEDLSDYSDPAHSWLNPANIEARYKNKVEKPNPRPKCSPLKLDLELFRPEARIGKRYTLWYRVTMRNVSCSKLTYMRGDFFTGAKRGGRQYHRADGFNIKVWDPLGKEVPDLGYPHSLGADPKYITEYADVIPYTYDANASMRLRADLPMDSNNYFHLEPGQSIATIPSILFPAREELTGTVDEFGNLGSGTKYIIVQIPNLERPPPGFRILEQFVFGNPGKYRIQVTLDDERQNAEPVYPCAERVPWQLGRILRLLGMVGGSDFQPVLRDERQYHVHAESRILEFEVKP